MFALVKLILQFFFCDPTLPLILQAGRSPSIKRLFLRFSGLDDDLLPTSKIITFLAKSLPNLNEPAISNVKFIHYIYTILCHYFLLYY